MIKAVIFEVDGVLQDSLTAHRDHCRDHAVRLGLPFNFTINEFQAKAASPMAEYYRTLGFPEGQIDSLVEHYASEVGSFYSPLFLGIRELLDGLQGYKLGIATSNVRRSVDSMLAENDLDGRFVSIVTKDEVTKPKPDPECIKLCMDEIGVGPHETIYIDDTPPGIMAGHAAGVRTFAAYWGWGMAKDLDEVSFLRVNKVEDFLPAFMGEVKRGKPQRDDIYLVTNPEHRRYGQICAQRLWDQTGSGDVWMMFAEGTDNFHDQGEGRKLAMFSLENGIYRGKTPFVETFESCGGTFEQLQGQYRIIFDKELTPEEAGVTE
ncbi:MAG: HAD family hydrolase [Candidatus Woesearchaeota archaeon]|nr:HAD family hydrolase [Candidatus Woesearchaeota archaeon]